MASRKIDRDHHAACYPICLSGRCGHYAAYTDNGDVGCLLLRSRQNKCPGKIGDHILAGHGCPAEPPLFGPADSEHSDDRPNVRTD